VWGLDKERILKWDETGKLWVTIAGPVLSQISAAGDGTVWGLDQAGTIYRRDGVTWTPIQGALTRISVGSKAEVWGVNDKSGNIFRWNADPGNPGWIGPIEGPATTKLVDVSVAADGSVWGVGKDKKAYWRRKNYFMPAAWGPNGVPGGMDMTQVSVGSSAQVWAVDGGTGEIYRWS